MNFTLLSQHLVVVSNIPATPIYGVYISHLIRYSRPCAFYHDFIDRGLMLKRGFLSGSVKVITSNTCGRHNDLINR
jgi:hypothetical protein